MMGKTGKDTAPTKNEDSSPTETAQAASAAGTMHPRLTTVCIIEDDADIREALCVLLEDEGYRVLEAADGASGLALLRSHQEQWVVLLNYKLPKMDGCELLASVIRDRALRTRHAFILVTANTQKVRQECGNTLDELAVSLVSKPFDIIAMLAAVNRAAQRLMES